MILHLKYSGIFYFVFTFFLTFGHVNLFVFYFSLCYFVSLFENTHILLIISFILN